MGLFDFIGDLFGGGSKQQQQQTMTYSTAPWTGPQQYAQNLMGSWLSNYLFGPQNVQSNNPYASYGVGDFPHNLPTGATYSGPPGVAKPMGSAPQPIDVGPWIRGEVPGHNPFYQGGAVGRPAEEGAPQTLWNRVKGPLSYITDGAMVYPQYHEVEPGQSYTMTPWQTGASVPNVPSTPEGMTGLAQQLMSGQIANPIYGALGNINAGQQTLQNAMGGIQGQQAMMPGLQQGMLNQIPGLQNMQGGVAGMMGQIPGMMGQIPGMINQTRGLMNQIPGMLDQLQGTQGQLGGMMGEMAGQIPSLNQMRDVGFQQYQTPWESPVAQGLYGSYQDIMNRQFNQQTMPQLSSLGGKYGLTGGTAVTGEAGRQQEARDLNLGNMWNQIMSGQQQMGQNTMLQAPQIAGQLGNVYGGLAGVGGQLGNVGANLLGTGGQLAGTQGQLAGQYGNLASQYGGLAGQYGGLSNQIGNLGGLVNQMAATQGGLSSALGQLGLGQGQLAGQTGSLTNQLAQIAQLGNALQIQPLQLMLALAGTGPGYVQTGGTVTGQGSNPSQGLLGGLLGTAGGMGIGSAFGVDWSKAFS